MYKKEKYKNVYVKAYLDFLNLCKLLKEHNKNKGSLEDLCEKLDGFNADDNLFDANYGVIVCTIYRDKRTNMLHINTDSIDIFPPERGPAIEISISISQLMDILSELGFYVDSLGVDINDITDYLQKEYRNYKVKWLLEHGYCIEDIINVLDELFEENSYSNILQAFKDFEVDCGFKEGEIWACFNEWLEHDFANKNFNVD